MAEERLIDDDKDRKYRIRKNKDGEDELYIVEDEEQPAAEEEEAIFAVPEADYDDEEAVLMTPEQLIKKREQEERAEAERKEKVESLLQSARGDMAENKWATAAEYLEKAADLDGKNGELYALRVEAYTRKFTDYSNLQGVIDYADELSAYTSSERKAQLFEEAKPTLDAKINEYTSLVNTLNEENEKQKAERAKKFNRDMKLAALACGLMLAGCVCLLVACIICAVNLAEAYSKTYLTLTILWGVTTLIALGWGLVFLRKLLIACRRVRLNKNNSATKLGRELISAKKVLEQFNELYTALKG